MTNSGQYVIELRHVSCRYGRDRPLAVNDLSIGLRAGVKTAVIGANGAGKSTLFRLMTGLMKPEKGKVYFEGRELAYRGKAMHARQAAVAMLPQNPDDQLLCSYVEDDVAFGPKNMGLSDKEVGERVDDALFRTGLTELRKSATMRLSYGQRKRVAFAGVIAMRPRVLILDEPTAGLDPQMASEVMEIAEQLYRGGTTVIISSHDTALTYAWADEAAVLRRGRCVYTGPQENFYADPDQVYLAGLVRPPVFSINAGLADLRGGNADPYPHTGAQLVGKLVGRTGRTVPVRVLPVQADCTAEQIKAAVAASAVPDAVLGIYGMSVRKVPEIVSVGIEYWTDGPEHCMLESLSGRPSMLLCDPAMVPAVREQAVFLQRYALGTEIEVLPALTAGPGCRTGGKTG